MDKRCIQCGGAIVHRQAAAKYCCSDCSIKQNNKIYLERNRMNRRLGLKSGKTSARGSHAQSSFHKS
jgi:hypothetical protein